MVGAGVLSQQEVSRIGSENESLKRLVQMQRVMDEFLDELKADQKT
jgi:hypothetical protein